MIKEVPKTAMHLERLLATETATVQFGRELAAALRGVVGKSETAQSLVIYFNGDLGAGKTTLCRGIVQGFGHTGAVKSPTFTLVEPYLLEGFELYHFDLYRLSDPGEFEFIGVDNYFDSPGAVCLVEWPERGEGYLPKADLVLDLQEHSYNHSHDNAAFEPGVDGSPRRVRVEAVSRRGQQVLENMESALA